MKIKPLSPTELQSYSIVSQKYGSIFNSLDWLSLYGENILLLGIYYDDGQLMGAFHLFVSKFFGLTHVKNPPFTPHIGLFFENKSENKSNRLSHDKTVLSLIADYLNQKHPALVTVALPFHFKDVQPFIWSKFKTVPNYSYLLDLKRTEDELWNGLSSERRNDIKKAQKDGVFITKEVDKKIVKEIVINTLTSKGKSNYESYLEKILFNFSRDTNSFAFTAYNNDGVLATCFCIYDTHTSYYLLGGYNREKKHNGAGAYALWSAILNAKKLGLNTFDFEGSMTKEIEKYFRGFGGEIIPYFTINKAWLPIEIGLKFIKREQF